MRKGTERTGACKTVLSEVPRPRLLRLPVFHAAADATWYRDVHGASLGSSTLPICMKCSMHKRRQ